MEFAHRENTSEDIATEQFFEQLKQAEQREAEKTNSNSKPEEQPPQPAEPEGHQPVEQTPQVAEPKETRQTPEEERRRRDMADRLFGFVEKYPQTSLTAVASRTAGNKRYLKTSVIGSIVHAQIDESSSVITVEFADSQRAKKRVIDNVHNFTMGDICETAFVLASRGKIEDIDEYEDEDPEDDPETHKDKAVLYFCLAAKDVSWSIEFPQGVAVLSVALTARHVLVLTDENVLRVFDYGKNEVFQASLELPVIAVCGFEHLAAVVFSAGLPAQGMQTMRLRAFDVDSLSILYEVPLALTVYKKLQWIGFSDDGVLYTQDTADCVRVLVNRQFWVSVFNNESLRKFWLLGVLDRDLLGYDLATDEQVPDPNYKYPIHTIQRKVKLATDNEKERQESLILKRFDVANDKLTNECFGFMKQTETTNPLRMLFKERVKDFGSLGEETLQLENEKVECIRRMLVDERVDAAIHFSLQLKSLPHFEIVLTLMEQLKLKKAKEDLTRLANEFGFFDRLAAQPQYFRKAEVATAELETSQAQMARRGNLRKYIEDSKKEDSGKHSFQGVKQASFDAQTAAAQKPASEPSAPQTRVSPSPPVNSAANQPSAKSVMEHFGKKNKQP